MASNKSSTANPAESIMSAIQSTSLVKVKDFLSHCSPRPQINCLRLPKSGDSPLHVAARIPNGAAILRYLIEEENGNVELANSDGKTPLHEAAQFNQLDSMKVLLEHGANVNALKRADWTPLMLACTKQDTLKLIQLLLKRSPDMCFTNKDGWNCFHIACREGNVKIIQELISHINKNCTDQQISRFLFSKSKNGRNPLHTAVMHGHREVCEILVEQARVLKQVHIISDTDNCGSTPIMEACRFGHESIIRLLNEYGGMVSPKVANGSGMNCLHIAAEAGQAKIIVLLKNEFGFDINEPNEMNGLTALHYAARENQAETIRILIELGANMDQRDIKGWTCLDLSNNLNKTQAVEILNELRKDRPISNSEPSSQP